MIRRSMHGVGKYNVMTKCCDESFYMDLVVVMCGFVVYHNTPFEVPLQLMIDDRLLRYLIHRLHTR